MEGFHSYGATKRIWSLQFQVNSLTYRRNYTFLISLPIKQKFKIVYGAYCKSKVLQIRCLMFSQKGAATKWFKMVSQPDNVTAKCLCQAKRLAGCAFCSQHAPNIILLQNDMPCTCLLLDCQQTNYKMFSGSNSKLLQNGMFLCVIICYPSKSSYKMASQPNHIKPHTALKKLLCYKMVALGTFFKPCFTDKVD